MRGYIKIKMLTLPMCLIIISCAEKKPPHYGVFIHTVKRTIEIPIGEEISLEPIKEPIVEEIKKISIRHPKAINAHILFLGTYDTLETYDTLSIVPMMNSEKKDIDWVIFKPSKKMEEGIYMIILSKEIFFENLPPQTPMAVFFYGSREKFQKFEEKIQEIKKSSVEAAIKSNMHTLQIALEDFATYTTGYYPIGLNVTPSEVYEECEGIDCDTITLLKLLPKNFKNPVDSTVPPVIVSIDDPPLWRNIKPGQVVYVPLEIVKKRAAGYKIYGKGLKAPLEEILSSKEF